MKKLIIVFFILVIAKDVLAQVELDPLSFFPSAVGNVWEYDTYSGILQYGIIKDSVDINRNKFIFYGSSPEYMIDTSYNVYWVHVNWLYYKLDADSGNTWVVQTYIVESDTSYRVAQVSNKYNSVVFGKPSTVIEITYYDTQNDSIVNEKSWPILTESLASGFGKVISFGHEEGPYPLGPFRVLRGCIIDGIKYGELTDIEEENNIPSDFKLYQNYPNPFNPSTIISYKLQSAGLTELKIYNILGQEITTLEQEFKYPGYYEVNFDASSFTSGIYIYRLTSGNFSEAKKLVLIR